MRYEYIDDPRALDSALDRIGNAAVVGVDTEAAGYHRYHDGLSLLQISSRDENLVIDPLALPDLSPVRRLLANSQVEKIFHDADFDLRILHRDVGIEVKGLFDTQIAAAFVGERMLGLSAIVAKFLGVSLPKQYQRADWAERPLTEGMKEYAATDTAYLPLLRDRLVEELERLGRVSWAREEFARREAVRWAEPAAPNDAYLRLKGARDLSPRGLAVLRELYRWRDEVGRRRDQAAFRVLSNQAMLEIALRSPTTSGALRDIQGVPAALAERYGAELIPAVRRGLAVSEDDLPRFPTPRRWERDPLVEGRSDRLRQTRAGIAEKLNLDPGFLISRAVLEEVAQRNPSSLDELAATSDVRLWQVQAFGKDLLRALQG